MSEDSSAVRARLDSLLREVLVAPGTTPGVARQVRWVGRTLHLALEREEFRAVYGGSLADLLGPGAAEVCRLTGEGELRTAELETPLRAPLASQRRRASVLRRLAAAAGVPSGAPSYPKPPPRPVLPGWARTELHARLGQAADRRPSDPARARALAVVGLVLDTAARAGELCALSVRDLAPDLSGVRIVRRPQADTSDGAATEVWPLSPATRDALRHWLAAREELVRELEGSADAVLVVLRANQGPYPRGMPLRPHGLATSYRAQVREMKAEVTGRGGKGWELPERMEQLRRTAALRHGEAARTPELTLSGEPEQARTAEAFARVVRALDALAEARRTERDEGAAVVRARAGLAAAVREAWARSGHKEVLSLLHRAGLAPDDAASAGYDSRLLRALEGSTGAS